LITAAVAASWNDSRAMTWHQWQVAYPIDTITGTPRRAASAKASGPHANHATGLSAWARR
jgi:hypothetical protein